MDLNSDVKIYIITHTPCTFFHSDIFTPIATNKELGDQLNIISSDQGDNVAEFNKYLAEFSTFYWAFKNDFTSKIIGFNHFRRYLIPNENKATYTPTLDTPASCGWDRDYLTDIFNNFNIILPYSLHLGGTVHQQYCFCHESNIITEFMEILARKYPSYVESFNNAFNNSYGYFCNLFIMRREDFNDYMTFVFDIFEEMKPTLFASHQYKPFAYLGERIFCGYVEYLKSVKGFRVKEVPTLTC